MLHNYLITALRNFTRHKLYSFINIAGLTVGLTCAIFIILFVRDELSYDRWIPGVEHLYRVDGTYSIPGEKPVDMSFVPYPAPDAMLVQLPEVKAALHIHAAQMTLTRGNRQFLDQVNVVSPNFFQIVQLPLVAGDRSTLFSNPESAVISESAAKKYFGSNQVVGQTLKVGGLCEYGDQNITGCVLHDATVMVVGIMRDLPRNTQLAGDVFIPTTSSAEPMSQKLKEMWFSASGLGFVELQPGADPRSVEEKLPSLIDRNFDPRKTTGLSVRGSQVMHLHLTPFRDDHLSPKQGGMTPNGSWTTIYGFSAIGALILLIACFNFTNLATARAMVRAKEISLRKVVGARSSQLMLQFLGESVLLALSSLVLALTLVEMLLPLYDRMLGKQIQLYHSNDWSLLILLVGLAVLVGLLAGFYPALVLSRFRPASSLRVGKAGQSGSGILRSAFVVMQFAVSIGLGIAALVVFAQISYVRNLDLGLNKDGIVVVFAGGLPPSALQSLMHALDFDPSLNGATATSNVPFTSLSSGAMVEQPGKPGAYISFHFLDTGPGFFSVYHVRLLSGRPLSESRPQDVWLHSAREANILINQAAADKLGYSAQNAVGKIIYGMNSDGKRVRLTIVGVTANFLFEGDRNQLAPTVYSYDPHDALISVRVPPGGVRQGLSAIDRIWHVFAPSMAINRFFLNEKFVQQFQADEQQGRIFGIFVGIAIFIACLGLFGLAAFSTERRIKEIGLRKTFGARTKDVIFLLLWQFSVPVLIANVIAWPVAYYYLHHWLEGYAYRINLSPLYFVGAGAAALIDRLGHGDRACRACGPRQSHPCVAL